MKQSIIKKYELERQIKQKKDELIDLACSFVMYIILGGVGMAAIVLTGIVLLISPKTAVILLISGLANLGFVSQGFDSLEKKLKQTKEELGNLKLKKLLGN